jgi:hypothetical protein
MLRSFTHAIRTLPDNATPDETRAILDPFIIDRTGDPVIQHDPQPYVQRRSGFSQRLRRRMARRRELEQQLRNSGETDSEDETNGEIWSEVEHAARVDLRAQLAAVDQESQDSEEEYQQLRTETLANHRIV